MVDTKSTNVAPIERKWVVWLVVLGNICLLISVRDRELIFGGDIGYGL